MLESVSDDLESLSAAQASRVLSVVWRIKVCVKPKSSCGSRETSGILLECYMFLSATQNTGLNVASRAGAGSPPPALLHRG